MSLSKKAIIIIRTIKNNKYNFNKEITLIRTTSNITVYNNLIKNTIYRSCLYLINNEILYFKNVIQKVYIHLF